MESKARSFISFLGDGEVVQSLHQHLSKFHFIGNRDSNPVSRQKAEDIAKNSNKVLCYQDIKSYTEKIKAALSK